MRLSENELQELYRNMTARRAGSTDDCLGEDLLIQAASNSLSNAEQADVAAHIARCSDCAREYRIARSLRPMRSGAAPSPQRWWTFAAAAAVAILFAGLIFSLAAKRNDERTIDLLRQQLQQRPPLAAPVDVQRPQLGVPIVDLDADATRGASASVPSVVVPHSSDVFALILHLKQGTARTVEMDLADHAGATIWRDRVESDGSSITIALHRRSVPAGEYTIAVTSAGKRTPYRFRVEYR